MRFVLPRFLILMLAMNSCAFVLSAAHAAPPPASGEGIEFALPSRLASKTLLLDAAKAGERIVAVGNYGHVIYSDDQGRSWVQAQRVPTRVTLTCVRFVSDKVGFAGGHDGTIIRTEDGGITWWRSFMDESSETPIMSLFFLTPLHGFAMGAFSFVVETHDGGRNWVRRSLSEGGQEDYHLNQIFRSKSGALFVAAEFGLVYRSTDDGKTFRALRTPYEGSFWGGLSLPDGAILVYGMRGNAYRSSNDGASWAKVETNTQASIGGGVVLSDDVVVLTGLQGFVGYSDNLGKSFTAVTREGRLGYSAVTAGPSGQIAIFGDDGVVLMPDTADAAQKPVKRDGPGG